MFCNDCGAEFSSQYCQNCGAPSRKDVSKYKISSHYPKFCLECGSELTGAYCTSCGRSGSTLKISAAQKFMAARSPFDSVKRSATSPSQPLNRANASENSLSISEPSLRYCLTAIFLLVVMTRFVGSYYVFDILPGLLFPNLLLLIVFSAGVYLAPVIAKDDPKTESYINGGIAGFCLLTMIFMLTQGSLSLFGAFLLILPILIIGYRCLSYWKLFESPPEASLILDNLQGLRIIWIFCVIMFLVMPFNQLSFFTKAYMSSYSYGSIISFKYFFDIISMALISVAAYLFEKEPCSKFKPAVLTLSTGCLLSLLHYFFNILTGGFGFLNLMLRMAALGISVYIGKDILSGLLGSVGKPAVAATAPLQGSVVPASRADTGFAPRAISSFNGGIGGLILPKIAKFVSGIIFMAIYLAISGVIGEVSVSVILGLLFSILYVVCAAYFDMLIYRWEIVNTIALGEPLAFNATFSSYIFLQLKILFLTLITCGIYASFGFAAVAVQRWKYRNTATPASEQSDFIGKWYEYLGYAIAVGFGSTIIALLATSMLSSAVYGSIGSLVSINSLFRFFSSPTDFVDNFISNLFQAGAIYIIFMYILFIFASGLIVYLFSKWEINGAIVGNSQWRFGGALMGAIGVVILNGILSAVTFGLYSVLGFAHLQIVKYKISNIV